MNVYRMFSVPVNDWNVRHKYTTLLSRCDLNSPVPSHVNLLISIAKTL